MMSTHRLKIHDPVLQLEEKFRWKANSTSPDCQPQGDENDRSIAAAETGLSHYSCNRPLFSGSCFAARQNLMEAKKSGHGG
jgi:hypothetical protein